MRHVTDDIVILFNQPSRVADETTIEKPDLSSVRKLGKGIKQDQGYVILILLSLFGALLLINYIQEHKHIELDTDKSYLSHVDKPNG